MIYVHKIYRFRQKIYIKISKSNPTVVKIYHNPWYILFGSTLLVTSPRYNMMSRELICSKTTYCMYEISCSICATHWTFQQLCTRFRISLIVRRAGLLWSQQDFEWRWSVPLFKCLTVLEFSFILFDLCLLITFFNFVMNYVPIVTFWIFTYHKIWILSIMFCSIWSYWIIYFLACLEVSWRVVS